MYKRKYGLEENETAFCKNMALHWTSTILPLLIRMLSLVLQGKKTNGLRWGCERRECKRNVQYSPLAIYG
jgi:hypothetical protein